MLCLDWWCSVSMCGSGESWTLKGGRSTWSWPRASLCRGFQRSRAWSGWSSTSRAWQSRAMTLGGVKVNTGHMLVHLPGPPMWRPHRLQAYQMQDAFSLRSETEHGCKRIKWASVHPRSLATMKDGCLNLISPFFTDSIVQMKSKHPNEPESLETHFGKVLYMHKLDRGGQEGWWDHLWGGSSSSAKTQGLWTCLPWVPASGKRLGGVNAAICWTGVDVTLRQQ